MTTSIELPLWLLLLILGFAAIAALDKVMIPSVRWFFRRRLERAVARLNTRLERPIQPFKLARRRDMIQRLIYDPQVSQAVVDHARAKGVPESVAFEEASRYAREIVPSFSASAYFGFAIRAARILSNALYRVRLGHHDEAALSEIDPEATVVFVMNHRSNMDYVLVTYLAAERSALSYAVGEWAQVWPLSGLIRAMGAYFIRRKSRNELYRKVLARYVRLATDAGVTQAMFPEGGLSQSGALMPPKLGLLKYIVDDFDPEGRDVVFVPVALNYDRVLEDRILVAAAHDPKGRFNARIGVVAAKSVKQLWLRLIGRYHRFGYAAVSFGEPLSLRTLHGQVTGDATVPLARMLIAEIGAIVPMLPVPIVSWLLIERGPMTRADVEIAFGAILRKYPEAHVHLPRDNRDYGAEVGLRNLLERKILKLEGDAYHVVPDQVEIVKYYANSIRHLMVERAPLDSAQAKEDAATAGS
ncbi:1-acyl-sn-glycerol-3-phosphate acyltransferase [Sedimentitalea todarodis]|uniref:Glycerol-3-phosphate acyltransferase n=1 Tax=Sedimentitalea todarodis TaxID=1631240 RepID=A0ABU3VI58_9RHOB|nr:1-acyl-sn-glycerol-3-phosphate acyltransferase [Sedimentitalea todarodis]MDU9005862.1 1-acyl-sn-glycerol-3-phosphate acyltransferase [Sedimentitalea todarodis]